ncbi:hypothetical protein V6N00_13840 [Tersicoccus sp. MR15.9]|uniref:hypothetical protein n=1 Tax=Tersicoccus mangrovi TaxID=3121635 RepID=UPI002FE6B5BA
MSAVLAGYGDETMALPVQGKTRRLKAGDWTGLAADIGLPAKAAASAARMALSAAQRANLSALPFTGSGLHRVERELRTRRLEIAEM